MRWRSSTSDILNSNTGPERTAFGHKPLKTMNEKQQNKEPKQELEKPKALTPQQIQQRRKLLVYPALFLIFLAILWLIFAPSDAPDQEQKKGLNTELPTPEQSGIVSDKRDAYVQQEMHDKQEAKIRTLEDYAFSLDDESGYEEAPTPAAAGVNPRLGGYESSGALHSSVGAYRNLNTQLGSFYEQQEERPSEEESKLLERIEQLEAELEQQQTGTSAEQQLELIEKSYQLASRYMNGNGGAQAAPAGPTSGASAANRNGKAAVQPVQQVRHEVVSLLAAPMSDSAFVEEYSQPRNWGFHTAAGGTSAPRKNSINACVYRTTTVTDGDEIPIRLLEPMMAGEVLIPANTILTGTSRIDGERMSITIQAVQYEGSVIPIELQVYDLDGGAGISVPASEEISAVKEIAANAGSGLGSSITITDDAGTQLLSDLGRSVIQGTAQYIGQKMRQVKVTLKAGYRVLLLPPLE